MASDLFASVGLVNAAGALLYMVNNTVPEPYMDEIFHVPQAQQYCQGNFADWNHKITTPAGLYLVAWLVSRFPGFVCSPLFLRAINVIAGLLSIFVMNALLVRLRGTKQASSWFETVTIVLFPVSFFFWFFFYTDTISTLLVLLGYLRALEGKTWQSSLFCSFSILFRQTNIIWLLLVLASSILNQLRLVAPNHAVFTVAAPNGSGLSDLVKRTQALLSLALSHSTLVFDTIIPFMPPLLTFAAFVVYNGGVVLGDKANHVASLHFPQLFYLASFTFVFSCPIILSPSSVTLFFRSISSELSSPWRFLRLMVATALSVLAIYHFTIHHIFLLSDNRHFVFYIWRHLFRRHDLLKYLYIPIYWMAGWHVWRALAQAQPLIWCAGFVVTVALTLIPSPLLEFRYFILPYLFFRLHVSPPNWTRLRLEFVLYTVVNIVTFWLFFTKPFKRASDPGEIQHFMW